MGWHTIILINNPVNECLVIVSTRNELEKAIAAIEGQQEALFEKDVVEVAILALREKLATLQAPHTMQQHDNICVLVADMSGFTSMSEFLDAEEVRDTMNAVWRRLDRIIVNWGGVIDKHLGDGIIALFGLPNPYGDDARRAVLAALDMQWELALFYEQEARKATSTRPFRAERRVQMRVGVHIGPVYFGQVGATDEVTAVGDTVVIANQLEQKAPVGGVLISSDLYEQVHPFFEADEYEPGVTSGDTYPAFIVRRETPQAAYVMGAGLTSIETRFVGRGDELNTLQQALQTAMDNSLAQIITIVGDDGVGKSRLVYEFERLITLLPESVCVLKGTGQADITQTPYGLIRSLLSSYFGIHPQHTPAIAREKLVRGVLNELHDDHDRAKSMVTHVTQLLGFEVETQVPQRAVTKPLTLYWEASLDSRTGRREIRGAGFEDLTYLFTAITEKHGATLLFLEDFHAADEGSYDFLDYLMQACHDLPLLIICLTRPSLFDKRPSWRMVETTERREIQLSPLSLIDARHLVTELLQKLEGMPMRLMDVISNAAGGNPFDLDEMVRIFIQEGVIEDVEPRWQANMGRLLEMPSPPTVVNLWRGQLEQLPDEERLVLQKAAVFGTIFWDAGLLALVDEDVAVGAVAINNTLQALLAANWIEPVSATTVPNTHQYRFRHDRLQQAIYETVAVETRQVYHAQAAAWLMTHSLPTTARLLRVVAYHLEQANDTHRVADWYGRAAQQARIDLALETSTFYYNKALELLPEIPETGIARTKLYEGKAIVLRKQSRFIEAIKAYQGMQETAANHHDEAAIVRAYIGEFLCHFLLDELRNALESIRPAESIAEAVGDAVLITIAQAARGWIALAAGQTKIAGELAREVYAHSRSLEPSPGRAFSRAFVGDLAREMGRYDQAVEMTNLAWEMFASFGETMWQAMMWVQLGHIAREQWDLDAAVTYYEQCLQLSRNAGDRFGTILALRHLGQLFYHRGMYDLADVHYHRALSLAERSQNQVYLAYLADDLGQLYLAQALIAPQSVQEIAQQEEHLHEAERWFERAGRLARKVDKPLVRVSALLGRAQLELEEHALTEAQEQAREAVMLAERTLHQRPIRSVKQVTAVAWRILGNVLAKVPQKKQQAAIGGKMVDAVACFTRSRQLLDEVGVPGNLEKAMTLRAWALLELRRDRIAEAAPLAEAARELLVDLGRQGDARRIQEMMTEG